MCDVRGEMCVLLLMSREQKSGLYKKYKAGGGGGCACGGGISALLVTCYHRPLQGRTSPACNSTAAVVEPRANRTPVTPQATQSLFSALSLSSRSRMSSALSRSTHISSLPIGPPSWAMNNSVKHPPPTPQKPDIRKQKAAENSPCSRIFAVFDWAVGGKLSENYFPRAWPWYDCTGSSVRLQGTGF